MRKEYMYISFLGLVSWLVPFAVSFVFVGKDGEFLIPIPLFKSIMVVIFGGFGAWLLTYAFRFVRPSFRSGLVIGGFWLVLNIAFDVAFLLPIMHVSFLVYFNDIGLRYILIPMMATAIGHVAERQMHT